MNWTLELSLNVVIFNQISNLKSKNILFSLYTSLVTNESCRNSLQQLECGFFSFIGKALMLLKTYVTKTNVLI